MNLKKRLKECYEQLISLKGEPDAIAAGLAIGVFIGVTPTIPFHTVLIVILCILMKKNITAGYLGTWLISNPLTIPFFYISQYRLGKCLLGSGYPRFYFRHSSLIAIIEKGWDVFVPLFVGGIIMAPLFAVPAYYIARRLLLAVRTKKHDHGAKNP
jgi:uncharacterized protein (DUF2062 family)